MGTTHISSLCSWKGCSPATKGSSQAVEPDAGGELPLWHHLRQEQGFTEDGIKRMQRRVKGSKRYTEEKVQRDLVPNIALLRAEGLGTPAVQRLYERFPGLLYTTHAIFSSSLTALRRLAELLPEDFRTVQEPLGASRLGAALWQFPTAAAHHLSSRALGSWIDDDLQLRRQLGMDERETALELLRHGTLLFSDVQRAEEMAGHLQCLQYKHMGIVSAQEVYSLVLTTKVLRMETAEFDQRWQACGGDVMLLKYPDPTGRQTAAAKALGELLQAAAGLPGPLQDEYKQQGAALVQRWRSLAVVGPTSLAANWAALGRAGMADRQIAAAVSSEPRVLSINWEGESKQLLAAWLQEVLQLDLLQFITQHLGYATKGVARMAMRADFLKAHRPDVWEEFHSRGTGPLLSLLTHRDFYHRYRCTKEEEEEFRRSWLQTPSGRRWGGKINTRQRQRPRKAGGP